MRAGLTAARDWHHGIAQAPSADDTLMRCTEAEIRRGLRGSYFFTLHPPGRPSPYDCVYAPDDRVLFRGARRTVSSVIRELADEGFDVGLHGSFWSAYNAAALTVERDAVELAAGRPVVTTRQHYLRWDPRRTPAAQQEAGLRADSTLGFNRNVGYRAGTSLPHFLFDPERRRSCTVLEIPLIVQESPLQARNALELDRSMAKGVLEHVFAAAAQVEGLVTLLFHPHSLLKADFVDLYEYALDRALAAGAWVATVADIDVWWRRRAEALGAAS